jgi:hypothetical protein
MGWNAWQAWTTWEWMASKVVQEIGALGTSVWQKYILCPNEHYPKIPKEVKAWTMNWRDYQRIKKTRWWLWESNFKEEKEH